MQIRPAGAASRCLQGDAMSPSSYELWHIIMHGRLGSRPEKLKIQWVNKLGWSQQ